VSFREGVVMVPEDAVLIRAEGSVVFRMVGPSQVERVSIVTGVHRDGLVEVVEGLAAGDVVVVRGQNRLIDGSVVDVRGPGGDKPDEVAASSESQAAR
jgi:hypothetical protein